MQFNLVENKFGTAIRYADFLFFFGKKPATLEKIKTLFPNLKLQSIKQVHGAHVIRPDETFSNETEADGVISKEPGVALCISTADCLPILMGSPNDKMAVALHAGWRGLEAEIVSKTVGQLVSLGINPQNFSVFVGPHITASNFEVGYDVAQRLDATFAKVRFDSKDSVVLNHPEVGKRRVDLDKLTLAQLKIVGIKPSHVKVIEADTIDNQEYHSFRRDGASAGRQISFVALIN